MIIKSMSRKVPSFGQLLGYIDRDEGQEGFTLRHNLLGRDADAIQIEFERNADLLQRRKNGVFLFHEIISITRAKGLSPEEQKNRLLDIASEYVAARCPDNLVYGGLHQDREHSFHMHLMISANRSGEVKRQRLTKHQFREIQVKLEEHVLEHYPELEQKLAIGKRSDRGRSKGEAELERRTGKRPKREVILERVFAAYEASLDRDEFIKALGREGLELYVRGKNIGVVDCETGKKHRLKTLDLELADQIELRLSEVGISKGEKAENQASRQGREQEHERQANADGRTADEEQNEATGRDTLHSTQAEKDMEPKPPSKERRELLDKGHVEPDPHRDLLSHEEWQAKDSVLTKVQQSWRRTLDDFRGRTKKLQERGRNDEENER